MSYVAILLSSAILVFTKHVQRESIPQPSDWQASTITTTLPVLRIRCVKVPYLSQMNEKKAIELADGSLDTTFFFFF